MDESTLQPDSHRSQRKQGLGRSLPERLAMEATKTQTWAFLSWILTEAAQRAQNIEAGAHIFSTASGSSSSINAKQTGNGRGQVGTMTCHACDKTGHLIRDCCLLRAFKDRLIQSQRRHPTSNNVGTRVRSRMGRTQGRRGKRNALRNIMRVIASLHGKEIMTTSLTALKTPAS